MKKTKISEFRKAVYQSLKKRADILFDLIDALTVAGQVSSPVALSEQKPFRRKFESVYDGLENGEMDIGEILSLLPDCVPEDSETIAGYTVYAVDATSNEHEEAETLPDRSALKSSQSEPLRYGHKYSWVARLIHFGTSWAAPVDVERISTEMTDTKLAAVQVQELDLRDGQAKVIVADSRYQDHQFLGIFEQFQRTFALIRLRSNGVLYEEPKQKPKGSRGAPRKHGPSFKLNGVHRTADREETFQLGEQTVRVQAWQKLHFKKLAALIGTLIQVEFLKTDGTPRYKRPMWLWWTGPQSVALSDLCRMYLWRFAIEHLFRFLKQHMGLNCNRSPNLVSATTMDLAVRLGLLAIAADAQSREAQSSGLVPTKSRATLTPHALSGATTCPVFFQGRHWHFCWGWAHQLRNSQTCRKRHGQAKELSPGSASSLSSDLQEQKDIQIPGYQSIIGICFSVFKVQFNCTFFVFYFATLKSS